MRRRQFLGATASGVGLVSLAGCTAPVTESRAAEYPPRSHPFANATVAVRIDDESESDHHVERNAREALAYWEDAAERYVGFGIGFEVVDEDPDLILTYVDEPSRCHAVPNYSENVLGCAPIVRPGRRLRDPVTAIVVAAERPFGKIRTTAKHEIGHVLGLGHDDDPREVMSNRPEDRIPLYAVRIEIWETVLAVRERASAATVLFSHGVENWNEGRFEASEAAFAAASEDFASERRAIERAVERTGAFDGHPEVETVDLSALRTHLDRLRRRTEAAESFADLMAAASREAAAGNGHESNGLASRANDRIGEFEGIGSPELRDVAVSLGLVRGFERDEEVVDVDEDEIDAGPANGGN